MCKAGYLGAVSQWEHFLLVGGTQYGDPAGAKTIEQLQGRGNEAYGAFAE